MFRVIQPVPDCHMFLFDNNKELALTFCRVQEYYESDLDSLRGKHFTIEEFIDASMDDKGNLDYFSYWDGFNFPGHVFHAWKEGINDLTKWEKYLIDNLPSTNEKPFYVIGALEKEKVTINHEIAHALFTLNEEFSKEMLALNIQFINEHKKEAKKLLQIFKILGYGENVFADEIQAYLSTDTKKDLVENFELDYDTLKPLITQYRKVLRKYNSYEYSA